MEGSQIVGMNLGLVRFLLNENNWLLEARKFIQESSNKEDGKWLINEILGFDCG